MSAPPVECPHCGYEIQSFTEALEALESGGRCLLCGQGMDGERLRRAVDSWRDADLIAEGAHRARDEAGLTAEEELFHGVPDFGDEGEEEEPL